MANRVCKILKIEKPIIQGPMAWSSFAPLVASVSNAGGLGVLGIAAAPNELVRDQIQKTKSLTNKPFGVNVFMIPPLVEAVLPVLLEEKPAVVYADVLNDLSPELCDFFFPALKAEGIKIIVKASTLKDAIVAEKCGADIVVAKGWEGGGHVTPETTMALLPQVASELSIPVVGSGGIADGRGMAAALALGAEAIEMGSVFLCACENTIHENAKQAILKAKDMESVVTGAITHEPCRQIPNSFSDKMIDLETNYGASEVVDKLREMAGPSLKMAMHDGDVENGAVMVGMIAPLINEIRPVKDIIDETLAHCKKVVSALNNFEY